jgi:hypothetical protein
MGTHTLVLRRSMLQTIIDNGKMAIETSTQRYGMPPHARATHRSVSDDSPVNMLLPIDEIWLSDRSLRSRGVTRYAEKPPSTGRKFEIQIQIQIQNILVTQVKPATSC